MATAKTESKSEAAFGSDLGLSRDELLEMYRLMVIARAVDERMWILNRAGKIPFVISGQGHEGAQVALAFALKQGHDWMVPYYRSVASLITFGMSPREIMLAQFARGVDPSSGGRQMPGHYGIKERNILSVSSPVATQILHATGIAWAAKLRKHGRRSRSRTWARARPTRATSTRRSTSPASTSCPSSTWSRTTATPSACPWRSNRRWRTSPSGREGYNMPGVIVDGADVLDCYAAGREAIDRARNGQGPTLIEAKVTRLTAHSSDDQQTKYRPAEEMEVGEGPRSAAALPRPAARGRHARRGDRGGAHRRLAQGRRGRD